MHYILYGILKIVLYIQYGIQERERLCITENIYVNNAESM